MLYRLVSGVQANINMHISHFYSHKGSDKQFVNLDVYYTWVAPFEDWLKNLHMAYSFVLWAINWEYENLLNYEFIGVNEQET